MRAKLLSVLICAALLLAQLCTVPVGTWSSLTKAQAEGAAEPGEYERDYIRQHWNFITNTASFYGALKLNGGYPTQIRESYENNPLAQASSAIWNSVSALGAVFRSDFDDIAGRYSLYDAMIYDIISYMAHASLTEHSVNSDAFELYQALLSQADTYGGAASDVAEAAHTLISEAEGGRALLERTDFKQLAKLYGDSAPLIETLGTAVKLASKLCDFMGALHISDAEYAEMVKYCYSMQLFMHEYSSAVEQLLSIIYEQTGDDMSDEVLCMTQNLVELLKYKDISEDELYQLICDAIVENRALEMKMEFSEVVLSSVIEVGSQISGSVKAIIKGVDYGTALGEYLTKNGEYEACLAMINCYGLFTQYLSEAVKAAEREFREDATYDNARRFHEVFRLYRNTQELVAEKYILPVFTSRAEGIMNTSILASVSVLWPILPELMGSLHDVQYTIASLQNWCEQWKVVDCCAYAAPELDGALADEPSAAGCSWSADFDGDGADERFFLDGAFEQPNGDTAYTELWYEDASGAQYVASACEYFDPSFASVLDAAGRKLFAIDEMTSGSAIFLGATVWAVEDGSPVQIAISDNQQDICLISQVGELDFSFGHNTYDTGHTTKPYFMYWNGQGFTEYGGLSISVEQLCAVNGAQRWLNDIEAAGGTITGIYYRENGIVNINYCIDGLGECMTLLISGDSVEKYREGRGSYLASVLDDASFPETFPYQAAPVPTAPLSSYLMVGEAFTDLDGDGANERLALYSVLDERWDSFDMRHMALVISSADDGTQLEIELQPYVHGIDVRVYAMPGESGQSIYVESHALEVEANTARYAVFEYDSGALSAELMVVDPGYTSGDYLGLISSPNGEEVELAYSSDSISLQERIDALNGAFAQYGIGFEALSERSVSATAPGRLLLEYASGEPHESADSGSYGGAHSELDDSYDDLTGGGEGTIVASNAGSTTWLEYADAIGGVKPLIAPTVSGSSWLEDSKYPCDPSQAFDGSSATAWCSDGSERQWLRVEWPEPQQIVGFTIINGYALDGDAWTNSARAKLITIFAGNGGPSDDDFIGYAYLDDDTNAQYFPLDGHIECSSLTLRFDDTYSGGEYDSLCLTDVIFYARALDEGAYTLDRAEVSDTAQGAFALTTANVNLRSGPGTTFEVLDVVPQGETISCLGESAYDEGGAHWLKVRYGSAMGWISSEYACLGISSTGSEGDASGMESEQYAKQSLRTTGKVYLRANPSINSTIICTIPKGISVSYAGDDAVDDRGVRWFKAIYDGRTGWVSSRYAEFASAGIQYVLITGGSTNLRSGPGLDYSSVAVLHKDDEVAYLGETSRDERGVNWYAVAYGGSMCWVSSRYAELK